MLIRPNTKRPWLALALLSVTFAVSADQPEICDTPLITNPAMSTSFCAYPRPKACPKLLVQSEPIQAILQCERITGGVYCSAWPQACSATGALMYHYSVEINGNTSAVAPSSNPSFRRNCSQGSTITFSVLVQNGGVGSSDSQTVSCVGPID